MRLEGGPNVLRVIVGSVEDVPAGRAGEEVLVELQTNLDDVSPEVLSHACRLLRDAGALDVWSVPAVMKKERAGVVLHALVPEGLESAAASLIFRETGSLGIRRQSIARHVAERGNVTVDILGVPVSVKWGRWEGRLTSVAAEYEDAVRAAGALRVPLKDVMQTAAGKARDLLEP